MFMHENEKSTNVLRRYVERRERCGDLVPPVKRLVFFIYDFTYAKELAPILGRIAPNCVVFNVGIPKMKTFPLLPTAESRYVADFISLFLLGGNACETLRVLHIFNFISLDPHLEKILKKCRKLRHLTVSNIDDVAVFELEFIESVVLDSCDFSITMFDENFADV
uniref:F-box/LRR-repeat protein n=2 Tax=Caenorhabditis tropicalis TaxID=1561998 RepID=A0A1I7UMY3_9PELO